MAHKFIRMIFTLFEQESQRDGREIIDYLQQILNIQKHGLAVHSLPNMPNACTKP